MSEYDLLEDADSFRHPKLDLGLDAPRDELRDSLEFLIECGVPIDKVMDFSMHSADRQDEIVEGMLNSRGLLLYQILRGQHPTSRENQPPIVALVKAIRTNGLA